MDSIRVLEEICGVLRDIEGSMPGQREYIAAAVFAEKLRVCVNLEVAVRESVEAADALIAALDATGGDYFRESGPGAA